MTFRLALLAPLFLAACLETPEERVARETQFNGMKVAEVAARIGEPSFQNAELALWQYSHHYTKQEPIQTYINGSYVIVGYRSVKRENKCTYTAKLSAGRVAESIYEGNSCRVFAPKPDV